MDEILCVWCDKPIGWRPWKGVTDNCICVVCFAEAVCRMREGVK